MKPRCFFGSSYETRSLQTRTDHLENSSSHPTLQYMESFESLDLLKHVHPQSLRWNLKRMVSKRNLLLQGSIFRFHVSFRGVLVFSFWMFVWKHYNPCNLCNPCMCKMYTCYLLVSFYQIPKGNKWNKLQFSWKPLKDITIFDAWELGIVGWTYPQIHPLVYESLFIPVWWFCSMELNAIVVSILIWWCIP